jgi:hypothetical protein
MKDWSFIKTYIISDTFLNILSKLSQIPLLGRLFRTYLFEHFSLSYDIIVNFIEGHEEATRMISQVIENQDFVSKILLEGKEQQEGAEAYMHSHIEDMFPEISKSI